MRFTRHKAYFIILLPILIYFHFRGLIVHDEGYVLNSADKLLRGLIPYKDFHYSYTPLSIFLTTASFILFGSSIFSSRILMLLLSLISCLLIYYIVKMSAKKDLYAFLAVIAYIAWGPNHINFAWPVMFVLPLTLLSIYLTLLYSRTKHSFLPFTIGLVLFGAFLAKQNFGIIFLPIFVHFLTFYKNQFQKILQLVYGYVWGVILFIIYLLATQSFEGFLSDFYAFTIKKVIINQDITTSILFIDTPIQTLFRAGIYFVLPVISVLSICILIYRKKYQLIFIPTITFIYFVVGMRPTSDYVHLVPLLSLVGLPSAILVNKLPLPFVKAAMYITLVVIITAGFQTSLFKGYYRWDIPLSENNSYLKGKAGIYTNSKFFSEYNEIKSEVDNYSFDGDYIYFDTYSPLLYFLLDRPQPNPYDFPGFISDNEYQELSVYSLVAKDVKVVFLTERTPNTQVRNYVDKKYKYIKKIGDYYLYVKLDMTDS